MRLPSKIINSGCLQMRGMLRAIAPLGGPQGPVHPTNFLRKKCGSHWYALLTVMTFADFRAIVVI